MLLMYQMILNAEKYFAIHHFFFPFFSEKNLFLPAKRLSFLTKGHRTLLLVETGECLESLLYRKTLSDKHLKDLLLWMKGFCYDFIHEYCKNADDDSVYNRVAGGLWTKYLGSSSRRGKEFLISRSENRTGNFRNTCMIIVPLK